MKYSRAQQLAGIIAATTACCVSLNAQVRNSDFSLGTTNWSIVFPPSNTLIPNYGVGQLDIDGAGPLPLSAAFYTQVGDDQLLNLQQNVSLAAGVSYGFHADLAMVPHAFNIDGGTVSVFVGPTMLTSYSFGMVTSLTEIKYASLSTNYLAAQSGSQTLSIHFSRGWGADGSTPTDYVDNITLLPVLTALSIQSSGSNVVLTWTNTAYKLQSAPSVSDTYTNVAGATSPYTNQVSRAACFFRLIAN